MSHRPSSADLDFKTDFEACRVAAAAFDHRAHLRLAYIYLCEADDEHAYRLMRSSIQTFLAHHGVDAAKYHETLTRAWLLAVRHFMMTTPPADSADAFIAAGPKMLDSAIMFTHYSGARLFSEAARRRFLGPDLSAIPIYV